MCDADTFLSAAIAVFTLAVIAASDAVCVTPRCACASFEAVFSWLARQDAQPETPRATSAPTRTARTALRSKVMTLLLHMRADVRLPRWSGARRPVFGPRVVRSG